MSQVTRVQLFHDAIGEVMRLPKVRDALHRQAAAIADRARGQAGSGQVADSIFVVDGTRPKGRPYSRAVSDPGTGTRTGVGKNERRLLLLRSADAR